MPNLRDFDDANLAGMAAFERWKAEFEAQFIADEAEAMVAQVLASMTPEQKAQFQAADPAAYDSLVKRLKVR